MPSSQRVNFGQKKSSFFQATLFQRKELPLIQQKVEATGKQLAPRNVTKIRSFSWTSWIQSTFSGRLLQDSCFSYSPYSKREEIVWMKKCEESFHELKKRLTSTPVWIIPDMDIGNFISYYDASKTRLGVVLMQNGKIDG